MPAAGKEHKMHIAFSFALPVIIILATGDAHAIFYLI
jgi:hypothetical protein